MRNLMFVTLIGWVILVLLMAYAPPAHGQEYQLFTSSQSQYKSSQSQYRLGEVTLEGDLNVSQTYIMAKLRGTGCFGQEGEPVNIIVTGSQSQNGTAMAVGGNQRNRFFGGNSPAVTWGMGPTSGYNGSCGYNTPAVTWGSGVTGVGYNSPAVTWGMGPTSGRITGAGVTTMADTATIELNLDNGVTGRGTASAHNINARIGGIGRYSSGSAPDLAALSRRAVDNAVSDLRSQLRREQGKTGGEPIATIAAPRSPIHIGSVVAFCDNGREFAAYRVKTITGLRLEVEPLHEERRPAGEPFKLQ